MSLLINLAARETIHFFFLLKSYVDENLNVLLLILSEI